MANTNVKERRKSHRITIVNPKEWLIHDNWELVDVSKGGAFIATDDIPSAANKHTITGVSVKLPSELGLLILPCKVVRIQWYKSKEKPKGFAVAFDITNPQVSVIFESWLNFVRNNQIVTVSKRIIEEFFGTGKGPVFK